MTRSGLLLLVVLPPALAMSCAKAESLNVWTNDAAAPDAATSAPIMQDAPSSQPDAGADATADQTAEASTDAVSEVAPEAGEDAAFDAPSDAPTDALPDAQPVTGLALHYKLDSTSGEEFDFSGHGNNGTVSGSVQRGVSGKDGLAFDFIDSGQISAKSSPSLDMLTGGTIEFWIKLSSVVPGAIVSRGTGSGDNSVRVRTAQGNLQVYFTRSGGGSASVTSDTNVLPTNGTWAHVAIVNDGLTIRIYVNGSLQNSGPGGLLGSMYADLHVGKNAANEPALNGAIDDLRWWTVARTAAEICADAGGTAGTIDAAATCTLP